MFFLPLALSSGLARIFIAWPLASACIPCRRGAPVPALSLLHSREIASCCLSSHEHRVFPNLAFQNACQQSRLDFKQPPIAYTVLKKRVGHKRIHSQFIRTKECFPPRRTECDRRTRLHEILGSRHARVD